jgi:hypothetical protein
MRTRQLAAVAVAVTLSVAATGCGLSAGSAVAASSRGASVKTIRADVQGVRSAVTVGELASSTRRLAKNLARASSSSLPRNPVVRSEWQQALAALSRAVSSLRPLISAQPQSFAPSPLQRTGSSADLVKDILDELNTGYDLLQKVVKGILALRKALKSSAAPSRSSKLPPSPTPTPTPSATPTPATYTLTIVNKDPKEGEVYAGDLSPANRIACGGAQNACVAQAPLNMLVHVVFDAFTDNVTGRHYVIESVEAAPQGCIGVLINQPGGSCSLTADTNTTITVAWKPGP